MSDDAEQSVAEETAESVEEQEVEQEAQAPAEEESADGESPSGEEESTDDKPSGLQKRFSQLTQRAKEAEAKAEQAEQARRQAEERVKFYESQQQEEQETPFPKLEDVEYDESAYQQKVAEWYQQQNSRSARQAYLEQQRTAAQLEAKEASQAAQELFKARADAFAAEHEDFYQTIQNPSLQVNQTVAQAALMSPNGPAIAYHIGKNPDVAAQLSQMNPVQALMEIGRIEGKLTTPASEKQTQAPAPQKPVGNKAPVSKDPDKMSPDEYRNWREKQRQE